MKASNQFPDVFQANKALDLCYATPGGGLAADIGGVHVTISTISLWTSDIWNPIFFGLPPQGAYIGNVGTVITQWSVSDPTGKFSGRLFTRDTIDSISYPSVEEDVIVGGTDTLEGATGTIQVRSVPMLGTFNIKITGIKGHICRNS